MPENNPLNLEPYEQLLQHEGLKDEDKDLIKQLIEQTLNLQAENTRLRKTLLRVNAAHNPRMSSKLKEALYE
ncbi:hypothetical protein D3C76_105530 [compost metagenome]